MEYKHFSLQLKAEGDARAIEGWAATFGNVDSDNDIILPGAFTKSLQTRKPKMLWQHRMDKPCGVWTEATETQQGLYVKGRLSATECGDEAYVLAKDGAIDSMSIGYIVTDYAIDARTGVRTIKECELLEVSLVTFPANEMARIMGVKSAPKTIRQFEEYLREGGFSQKDATTVALHGFKALSSQGEPEPEATDPTAAEQLVTLLTQFKL